ncbi:hypothetical protein [Saccharopolyspora hordei]|uniref:Uncharacterized protein n=1 Tax=Saccharopolyspora hordei TaxID=1838 RepID=A0A853ASH7_9PSEU|nr:hypothetical protein [Saccharopolyspora hordei]NYI85121.1 hypothetical protein [Saccharopolyspora hordei]
MDGVQIGLSSFLDYVRSTPRGCAGIVRDQWEIHVDETSMAWTFYAPFRSALRRAVSSPDAPEVLAAAVRQARPVQQPHFQQLHDGFRRWWAKVRATGVPMESGVVDVGGLSVTVSRRSALALRYRDGRTEVVLPYLKEPELASDSANVALRVLEHLAPSLLPGARPMVLDVRRGRAFRLRRNANRDELDAVLAAEAAKYLTHWAAMAEVRRAE